MPLREYECAACGHRFERIEKFSDPHVKVCPQCGGEVHKLMSAPAVQFKGSGWYVTDYAGKGKDKGKDTKESKDSKETKDRKESSDSTPKDTKTTKEGSDSGTKDKETKSTKDSTSNTPDKS